MRSIIDWSIQVVSVVCAIVSCNNVRRGEQGSRLQADADAKDPQTLICGGGLRFMYPELITPNAHTHPHALHRFGEY